MRLMPICWYANLVRNLNSGPTGGGAMDRKLAGILAADVYSTDAIVLPSTHAIVRGMGEIRELGRMPRRTVVSDESVIPSKYAGPCQKSGKAPVDHSVRAAQTNRLFPREPLRNQVRRRSLERKHRIHPVWRSRSPSILQNSSFLTGLTPSRSGMSCPCAQRTRGPDSSSDSRAS